MNASALTAQAAHHSALPDDDELRETLHNEVHARPSARIRLPALVVSVAVMNQGVSREDECAHLQRLPGQAHLTPADLQGNFLRLRFEGHTLKWERHSEFTRYVLVQPLPAHAGAGAQEPELLSSLVLEHAWMQAIPGRTVAAVMLVMATHDITDAAATLSVGRHWFGGRNVVASMMGNGHSVAITNFRLQPDGFERILVLAPEDTSETRVGRVSQRLLELEIYRLMALRGLPVAKKLAAMLAESEAGLADVTAQLEGKLTSENELLDTLIHVAARVERATAEHMYRFSATQAYAALVSQRIAELRERAIPGTQTIGEFMQRRLSPAIATVDATAQRLASLSQRIERASALLRTRVDIATETQNQQLLAKLTQGQALQLSLQSTVEGLSIAAISYYMISLLLYAAKALKSAGVPIHPELATGAMVPLVLLGVWVATRRIHKRVQAQMQQPMQ